MSFTSFLSDRGSKQPQTSDTASSYLSNASFSQPSSSSSFVPDQPTEPTAQSLFASSAFDPAKLHPLAGLGSEQQLDYLLLEDDKTNLEGGAVMGNRGFFDDVQAGTGTAYISGLFSGSALGAMGGLRKKGIVGGKLRWNAVLNGASMRGTYYGNTAGTLAFLYNVFNNIVPRARPDNKQDVYTSVASGALAGALFKSTAGLRPCLTASAIMAAGAAGWNVARDNYWK